MTSNVFFQHQRTIILGEVTVLTFILRLLHEAFAVMKCTTFHTRDCVKKNCSLSSQYFFIQQIFKELLS